MLDCLLRSRALKSKIHNLRWSATVALVLVVCVPSPLVWSQMSQIAPTSIQELSQWPARERAQLQQKQTRFEQLGENEKHNLRQFHQTLQKDPARDQLTRIMHSYTQWLLALPSVERRRILSLPLAERLGEVEKIVNEQKASRFKELLNSRLDFDDLSVVADWMNDWMKTENVSVSKLVVDIMEKLSEEVQNSISSIRDPATRLRMTMFASLEKIEMQKWTKMFPQLLLLMLGIASAYVTDASGAQRRVLELQGSFCYKFWLPNALNLPQYAQKTLKHNQRARNILKHH